MRRLTRLWLFDWRKVLVYTHRWLGIAGCVLFVAWFISGIVMMYARMPGLANEERLARAPALDLSTVTVSPAEAAGRLEIRADRVQIGMHGGRPVYRFGVGRRQTIVFADTAAPLDGVSRDEAMQVARRYAPRHPGAIRYDRFLTEPDQWTLQARAAMPMHVLALDDAADTYLYVSEAGGDVVLRTTRRERVWGYFGPVIHWLYFTPLRRNGPLWSEVVIWTSLVGCLMCASGLVWGLWRFSPTSRFRLKRESSHTPYAGWMKWHHYAGLLFGVVTLTWTYSGLLSMGPFNWFATPPMSRELREASSGGHPRLESLTLDSMRLAAAAIGEAFAPKELDVVQFNGEPFWLAHRAPLADDADRWMNVGLLPRSPQPRLEHRYVSVAHPERGTFTTFDLAAMADLARTAMPEVQVQDSEWLQHYDGYYYDPRGSLSLPVLRVRYADDQGTWLYLDPERGKVVLRSVRISRRERWLYQGLHSLDFPFLYFRRPLWDLVAIVLSIGGAVLSLTTIVPALRRFRRIGRAFRRSVLP
jgi:PepSY-associated transmembrane protein